MSSTTGLAGRVAAFLNQRSLCRSVDHFIADLEALSQQPQETVDANNVRAQVEAMVDLLEGRLDWAPIGLRSAQRLATRVYEIRRVEEQVLTRLRDGATPAALLGAADGTPYLPAAV